MFLMLSLSHIGAEKNCPLIHGLQNDAFSYWICDLCQKQTAQRRKQLLYCEKCDFGICQKCNDTDNEYQPFSIFESTDDLRKLIYDILIIFRDHEQFKRELLFNQHKYGWVDFLAYDLGQYKHVYENEDGTLTYNTCLFTKYYKISNRAIWKALQISQFVAHNTIMFPNVTNPLITNKYDMAQAQNDDQVETDFYKEYVVEYSDCNPKGDYDPGWYYLKDLS